MEELKDIEIRIVVELMRNSRRSDREIARVVGVSQPTVGRIIRKLEKRGVIKEYTMIPNFQMLGFAVMGLTRYQLPPEPFPGSATARKALMERYGCLLAVEGMSQNANRQIVSLYETYSEYWNAMNFLKTLPSVDTDKIDSLLVDLNDQTGFRHIGMSTIAERLLQRLKKEENPTHPKE